MSYSTRRSGGGFGGEQFWYKLLITYESPDIIP